MSDRPARSRRRGRTLAAAVTVVLGLTPGAVVTAPGAVVVAGGAVVAVAGGAVVAVAGGAVVAVAGGAVVATTVVAFALEPATAMAATASGGSAAAGPVSAPSGSSLEDAATRAGDTGRKVAFSLIGLALAVAAIVLCFKRDFKEAVGVLAIGLVAVLLASPTGVNVLQQTVSMLFGGA
jgi:hypothetical protein